MRCKCKQTYYCRFCFVLRETPTRNARPKTEILAQIKMIRGIHSRQMKTTLNKSKQIDFSIAFDVNKLHDGSVVVLRACPDATSRQKQCQTPDFCLFFSLALSVPRRFKTPMVNHTINSTASY